MDTDAALAGLAGGTCFDFSSFNPGIFVVGTEEGKIRKCSRAYNSQYLFSYEGHTMPIYRSVYVCTCVYVAVQYRDLDGTRILFVCQISYS